MVNRCTVIKNGRATDVFDVEHMSQGELALKMIGHPFDFVSAKQKCVPGDKILEVCNMSSVNDQGIKVLDRLNFCVREGEMVGIVGSDSNGSNELVEIFLGVRLYKADYLTLYVIKGLRRRDVRKLFLVKILREYKRILRYAQDLIARFNIRVQGNDPRIQVKNLSRG